METIIEALRREPLRLADHRPKPSIRRTEIKVPAGHKMRLDGEVINPFKLIVEAGVRWHPDWPAPRVTVNGWRVFPMGDALGWAGEELVEDFGELLEPEIKALCVFHGLPYSGEDGDALDKVAEALVNRLSLSAPTAPQALATFILPEQYGRRVH